MNLALAIAFGQDDSYRALVDSAAGTPVASHPENSDPLATNPITTDAMLRDLSANSEGFAYGSTALAAALDKRHHATVAAHLPQATGGVAELSRWECRSAEHGIELAPLTLRRGTGSLEIDADDLLGAGGPGDVLIACDPLGDNELLCWTLRLASYRRMTTVALTDEQPNLLAALATHAVRVPTPAGARDAFVTAALRFLVQTAGGAMASSRRRATQPMSAALLA